MAIWDDLKLDRLKNKMAIAKAEKQLKQIEGDGDVPTDNNSAETLLADIAGSLRKILKILEGIK